MLFSDILNQIYGRPPVAMPLGGPFGSLAPLTKSASNATGASIPGVRPPPMSSPSDFMNAATSALNVQGENKLRDAQMQQALATIGLMKAAQEPMPSGGDNATAPIGGLSASPNSTATTPSGPSAAPSGAAPAQTADGMLSIGDMKEAAMRAGFKGDAADIMAATAMAESSGNPNAANEKGEHSYGITQINADAHGPVAREALGNPDRAMQIAFDVSKGGTNFAPWTMYKNGTYKQYLDQARAHAGDNAANAPVTERTNPTLAAAINQAPASGAPISLDGPTQLAQNGPLTTLPGGPPAPPPQSAAGPPGVPGPAAAVLASQSANKPGDAQFAARMKLSEQYANALDQGFHGTIQDFVRQLDSGAGTQPSAPRVDLTNGIHPPFDNAAQALVQQPAAPPPPQAPAPFALPAPVGPAPSPPPQGAPQAAGGAMGGAAFGALAPLIGNMGQQFGVPQYGPDQIAWARKQDAVNAILGKRNPTSVDNILQMAPGGTRNLSTIGATESAKALGTAPFTDFFKANLAAQLYPAGSPQRAMAEQAAAHAAGIKPVLGGERPGVPLRQWNPATGSYDITAQVPSLGRGEVFQNGTVSNLPGSIQSQAAASQAEASGPASFKPQPFLGPGNTPMVTSQAQAFSPGAAPLQTGLSATEEARTKAQGTNEANLGPLLNGGQGGAPAAGAAAADKPTQSQFGMIPPLSQQKLPASPDEIKAAIPQWTARVNDWTKGIDPARQAEQRLMTIAQAFKATESGSFAEQKGNIAAALKAAGINVSEAALGNPAALQLALHENILTTLPLLKAATPRPTQTEFVTTSENREHPNIQPEANLQMLAEDIALMRQAQNLPAAYNASKWSNPFSFETAYFDHNKLEPMVNQVKGEIGPLKGMAAPPATAVEYLRTNPNARNQFDAKYGAGSAGRVLGQ